MNYNSLNKIAALKLLADREKLAQELPEVLALADCEQLGPYHAEGDVLTHTKLVVQNLLENASPELIWAGILHDVAKPLTKSEKERNGEIINQFIGHEKIGAEIAYNITGRLGLSEAKREKIRWLVANHMRILSLPVMRPHKAISFVTHPNFPELLEILRGDIFGSRARTAAGEEKNREMLKRAEEIYQKYCKK